MSDLSKLREDMVENQIAARSIRSAVAIAVLAKPPPTSDAAANFADPQLGPDSPRRRRSAPPHNEEGTRPARRQR